MKMFLLLSLFSFPALAQMTTSTFELPSFSFQKLRERTRINYFSETLGPSIKKWDDNEVNVDGSRSNMPVRTFHSFNTQVKLVDKFSFFLSPRFVSVIGDRNEIGSKDDPHILQMDDWQIGFTYDFIKTPDFSYSQRLTHRHPFSVYSNNSGIDSQIEWQHAFTWQPRAGWRIINWHTYRYYKYQPGLKDERYRINTTTLINYDFNDFWKAQLMHEWDMQHRNPNSGPKARAWNFFKQYENHVSFGLGYSPVRNLTLVPFIRVMDPENIRNETAIVGLWVLGRIL